jgi:hypothetical protein
VGMSVIRRGTLLLALALLALIVLAADRPLI